MDTTTWILAAAALILLGLAFWRGRDLPLAGLQAGARTLWRNLPVLLLGNPGKPTPIRHSESRC